VYTKTVQYLLKAFLHHVKSLKNKIAEYKFNPFEDCTAKDITTCKELDKDVVKQLLSAPLIDNDKFVEFLKQNR